MAKWMLRASMTANVILLAWVIGYFAPHALHAPEPSTEPITRLLQPQEVDPTWIKSGEPRFRVSETFALPHSKLSTGLWSCDGPALFDWTFGVDETVHILEGEVEIQYLGKTMVLKAGDTSFFRAGTTAQWHVKDRVYKSFVLHDPGRLSRWYRRIAGA